MFGKMVLQIKNSVSFQIFFSSNPFPHPDQLINPHDRCKGLTGNGLAHIPGWTLLEVETALRAYKEMVDTKPGEQCNPA